jgi:hypothetical protein
METCRHFGGVMLPTYLPTCGCPQHSHVVTQRQCDMSAAIFFQSCSDSCAHCLPQSCACLQQSVRTSSTSFSQVTLSTSTTPSILCPHGHNQPGVHNSTLLNYFTIVQPWPIFGLCMHFCTGIVARYVSNSCYQRYQCVYMTLSVRKP